jgi:hypothetical protein
MIGRRRQGVVSQGTKVYHNRYWFLCHQSSCCFSSCCCSCFHESLRWNLRAKTLYTTGYSANEKVGHRRENCLRFEATTSVPGYQESNFTLIEVVGCCVVVSPMPVGLKTYDVLSAIECLNLM